MFLEMNLFKRDKLRHKLKQHLLQKNFINGNIVQ